MTKNNKNNLIAGLEHLGLSQYEAKCYIALLAHGISNGYTVAKHAGIPTSKVYSTLASLQEKGFISSNNMNKKQYRPYDPNTVLKQSREKIEKNMDIMEDGLNRIFTADNTFSTVSLSSAHDVDEYLNKIILSATKKVLITAWPEELDRIETILQERCKDIEIFILCYGTYKLKGAKVFLHRRAYLVKKETPGRMILAASDGQQALAAHFDKPSVAKGTWWQNTGITGIIADHILHDISLNHIMESLSENMQQKMEKTLTSLRKKLYIQ